MKKQPSGDPSAFAIWFGGYPSVLPVSLTGRQLRRFRRFLQQYPSARLTRHRGVISGYCVDPNFGPVSFDLSA